MGTNKQSVEASIAATARLLREAFGEDKAIEALDELVHDAKGDEAASINNEGLYCQVRYLIESGCTPAELIQAVKDSDAIHDEQNEGE